MVNCRKDSSILGKRDQILRAYFNEKVATSVSHQNFVTFLKEKCLKLMSVESAIFCICRTMDLEFICI